jgi:PilZ domain
MGSLNLSSDRNSRQTKAFRMVRKSQNQAMVSERRSRQRFSINAPLTLFIGDREIPAYTRDLSNRGVYFYLALADLQLADQDFEFLVELPPEITLSSCCRIRCHGRAVREEKTSNNLTGIAAEILDYSILRDPLAIP